MILTPADLKQYSDLICKLCNQKFFVDEVVIKESASKKRDVQRTLIHLDCLGK